MRFPKILSFRTRFPRAPKPDTMLGVVAGESRQQSDEPCGRDRLRAGAEGATAPETLRQKDRRGMTLWKAGGLHRLASPTE